MLKINGYYLCKLDFGIPESISQSISFFIFSLQLPFCSSSCWQEKPRAKKNISSYQHKFWATFFFWSLIKLAQIRGKSGWRKLSLTLQRQHPRENCFSMVSKQLQCGNKRTMNCSFGCFIRHSEKPICPGYKGLGNGDTARARNTL